MDFTPLHSVGANPVSRITCDGPVTGEWGK